MPPMNDPEQRLSNEAIVARAKEQQRKQLMASKVGVPPQQHPSNVGSPSGGGGGGGGPRKKASYTGAVDRENEEPVSQRQMVVSLIIFAVILTLVNLGTSYSAVKLATDTEAHGDNLVNVETGERMATTPKLEVYSIGKVKYSPGILHDTFEVNNSTDGDYGSNNEWILKSDAQSLWSKFCDSYDPSNWDGTCNDGGGVMEVTLQHCGTHTLLSKDADPTYNGIDEKTRWTYAASRGGFRYGHVTIECHDKEDVCVMSNLRCGVLCTACGSSWFCNHLDHVVCGCVRDTCLPTNQHHDPPVCSCDGELVGDNVGDNVTSSPSAAEPQLSDDSGTISPAPAVTTPAPTLRVTTPPPTTPPATKTTEPKTPPPTTAEQVKCRGTGHHVGGYLHCPVWDECFRPNTIYDQIDGVADEGLVGWTNLIIAPENECYVVKRGRECDPVIEAPSYEEVLAFVNVTQSSVRVTSSSWWFSISSVYYYIGPVPHPLDGSGNEAYHPEDFAVTVDLSDLPNPQYEYAIDNLNMMSEYLVLYVDFCEGGTTE